MRSLTARRQTVYFEMTGLCSRCADTSCKLSPGHKSQGEESCRDFYPQALVDEEQGQEHVENDEPALSANGRMWAGLAPNRAWPLSRP